jgi:transcriptional regulator with XRE-family HTH domain
MLEGLRRLRRAAGLTQRQLTAAAEVSVNTLSAWEKGWRRPRTDLAFQVTFALQVALAYIVSVEALRGRAEVRRLGPRRGRGE